MLRLNMPSLRIAMVGLLCSALCLAACNGGKTAATTPTKKYVPTGISLSMLRLLEGKWEAVGINIDGKPAALPAKSDTDLLFAKGKMTLNALGKKESTNFTVKDKTIICPDTPAERPLRIASITRTDLVLNFTASNGKPVEMFFLRK